ncbi:hypothetical protein [Ferruginibacter sp.]|nr:hypothetical protein [Ferruginibacter sp.]
MAQALNISDVKLFNLIKAKFGEKEAEEFVALVKQQASDITEEKQQLIIKDVAVLRDDINKDFKYFRDEVIRTFATKEDLAKTETKLLLWAFVFWATQLGAIFAFLKFFIK